MFAPNHITGVSKDGQLNSLQRYFRICRIPSAFFGKHKSKIAKIHQFEEMNISPC